MSWEFSEKDFADIRHLLPDSILGMIQVAGIEAVLNLVKRFGGTNFPVGMNKTKAGKALHAALAEEVGEEVALKLGRAYASQRVLWIPKCEEAMRELRNRFIRKQFDELTMRSAYPVPAISAIRSLALAHNLTERRVWQIMKETDQVNVGACQDSLF